MAGMIPDILPETIANNGERLFYSYAMSLPEDYTVLYSYRFYKEDPTEDKLLEADFIIVHPALGYVVIEVKQGDIRFFNGLWHEYKNGNYIPLHKDPVAQAQNAMFEILTQYKKETKGKGFPLGIRYALCFPECSRMSGIVPKGLKENSIWTFDDLEVLPQRIKDLFTNQEQKVDKEAANIYLKGVDCNVYL